jgi:Rieske Fe-S protein
VKVERTISRRALLAGGVGVAGAVTLAACATGNSGGKAGSDQAARQPTDKRLATLADIPVGQCVSVDLPDGKPGIVGRPTAGTAVCFSAICTHAGCTVMPDGTKLTCPCHGSQFDSRTGKVLRGPAPTALSEVPVRVANGRVITA